MARTEEGRDRGRVVGVGGGDLRERGRGAVAQRHDVGVDVEHAAAAHRRRRRPAEILDLEEQLDDGRDREALAVRERERLVVVEHGVEVLGPLRVDVAVEDDPVALAQLPEVVRAHRADDGREQAVGPLERRRVQLAEEQLLVVRRHERLGVDDVGDARDAVESFETLEHAGNQRRLADARAADDDGARAQRQDAPELERLVDPRARRRLDARGGPERRREGGAQRRGARAVGERVPRREVVRERVGRGARGAEDGGHQLRKGVDVDGDEARRHRRVEGREHGVLGFLVALYVARVAAEEEARAREHGADGAQPPFVVGLGRQLRRAELEEAHEPPREAPRGAGLEALGVERRRRDGPRVGPDHGHGAEELLQVLRQRAPARVARVHGHEDARRRPQRHAVAPGPAEVDARVPREQRVLDRLELLRHGAEHALVEAVELVEAAPGAGPAQALEQPPHRAEVEGLVAVEDDDVPTEVRAERAHGLGLARARGPHGVAA